VHHEQHEGPPALPTTRWPQHYGELGLRGAPTPASSAAAAIARRWSRRGELGRSGDRTALVAELAVEQERDAGELGHRGDRSALVAELALDQEHSLTVTLRALNPTCLSTARSLSDG
jgi:hypothetical protein